MIDIEEIKSIVEYLPDDGIFLWKRNRKNALVGKVAGSNHGDGYIKLHINHKKYMAHRLAYMFHYGQIEENNQIDHINGKRNDNRISNLRSVNVTTNNENLRGPKKTNKCGFLGVRWHKKDQKWQAKIQKNGKQKHLGYFDSPEKAHEAYLVAKRIMHSGCTI